MTKLIVNVVVIAAAIKERVGANWTTTIDSFEAVRICITNNSKLLAGSRNPFS